jgi:hypothetical protein
MDKKTYQSPSSKTIILRQQTPLLAGSGGLEATRNGYGAAETDTWE